jgi:hypothetical protein
MISADEQMAWVEGITGEFSLTTRFGKFTEIVGLEIKQINMTGHRKGESLAIWFTDGRFLSISDQGQSCCETRYLTCDDDLTGHEGGHLLFVDKHASGPEIQRDPEQYGQHDTAFVKVQTTKGSFTICTHNEHSGYYGGFALTIELVA